jgi:hypothetical protein
MFRCSAKSTANIDSAEKLIMLKAITWFKWLCLGWTGVLMQYLTHIRVTFQRACWVIRTSSCCDGVAQKLSN